MKCRKLSVHEVHRHGEETYSKKSRLEEIIPDPPKPDSAQQENFPSVYLVVPVDSSESLVVRTTTELGCYYVSPLSVG